MGMKNVAGRRGFIKQTAAMTAGLAGFGMIPEIAAAAPDTGVNIIGPKPGYSPQVGTMVSMLTWMQGAVVGPVQGMTKQDLDYLFDAHANSIGALLLLHEYQRGVAPHDRRFRRRQCRDSGLAGKHQSVPSSEVEYWRPTSHDAAQSR